MNFKCGSKWLLTAIIYNSNLLHYFISILLLLNEGSRERKYGFHGIEDSKVQSKSIIFIISIWNVIKLKVKLDNKFSDNFIERNLFPLMHCRCLVVHKKFLQSTDRPRQPAVCVHLLLLDRQVQVIESLILSSVLTEK